MPNLVNLEKNKKVDVLVVLSRVLQSNESLSVVSGNVAVAEAISSPVLVPSPAGQPLDSGTYSVTLQAKSPGNAVFNVYLNRDGEVISTLPTISVTVPQPSLNFLVYLIGSPY